MTVSSNFPRDLFDEIHELADAVVQERATDEQRQRLAHLVRDDAEACRLYVHYMNETVAIRRLFLATRRASSIRAAEKPRQ